MIQKAIVSDAANMPHDVNLFPCCIRVASAQRLAQTWARRHPARCLVAHSNVRPDAIRFSASFRGAGYQRGSSVAMPAGNFPAIRHARHGRRLRSSNADVVSAADLWDGEDE